MLAGFCSSHRWNRAEKYLLLDATEINLSHSCKGEWLPNLAVYMLIEQPFPVTLGSHSSESIVSRGSLEEYRRPYLLFLLGSSGER